MRLTIGYVHNPANTCQCTWEQFMRTICDENLLRACNQLAAIPYDAEHKEERQALKKKLPAFCFNSKHFKDDYRKNENATPSGYCMIDWDGIDDPDAWLESFGWDPEDQIRQLRLCGLCGFHVSASRHGFHGIIRMREGETIEEAQARVARHMGKEDYDKGAHALSQSSYAVPIIYWLFLDEEELMDYEDEVEEVQAVEITPSDEKQVVPYTPKDDTIEEAVVIYEEKLSDQQDAYDGVPMQLIVNSILLEFLKLDSAPVEGTRNNRYFELERHVRYFCEFDAETMLKVSPDWGLPENERRDICLRAVKYDRVMGLPRQLQDLLERLKGQIRLADGLNVDGPLSEDDPMPENLPKVLQLILKLIPAPYREAAFFCSMPFLGTLTTALHYKHSEVMEERTSFQVYLRGHMASGKGFTRVLNKYLMTPIDAEDAIFMARENNYREECIAAGDGKKSRDPHNVIRRVQADFTLPALRKQLLNSRKQHLILFNEESDSLTMNKQTSSILRCAFDGVKSGQTRVSAQSVNGEADTLINTLFCGTPAAMQRMLANPEDGLVSRTIFVDLSDRLGFDEPEYGHLTPKEYQELEREVTRLHKIGLLENVQDDPNYQPEHYEVYIDKLPRTEELIKQFTAACKLHFVMNGCKNIALDKFSRRIPTMVRRISMVLYAAENNRETTRSICLLRWAANRMLKTLLNFYGHQYEDIYQKSILCQSPYKYNSKNSDLINLLPDTFTAEDIVKAQQRRGIACTIQNARVIATRLKGTIEPTGVPNHWKKLPEKV